MKLALAVTPLGDLMDHEVTLDFLRDPVLTIGLVGLTALMGLLAGAYPAFYLSHWAPLTALTGRYLAGKVNLLVREGLVVLQFTVSTAVIAATLLMMAQMHYVASKDLGFSKENRLVVTLRGVPTLEKVPSIRSELASDSHILGIAQVNAMLGETDSSGRFRIEDNSGAMESRQLAFMPASPEFARVMGLKMVKGRDFSQDQLTDDSGSTLVNEALVRQMGWTEPVRQTPAVRRPGRTRHWGGA